MLTENRNVLLFLLENVPSQFGRSWFCWEVFVGVCLPPPLTSAGWELAPVFLLENFSQRWLIPWARLGEHQRQEKVTGKTGKM